MQPWLPRNTGWLLQAIQERVKHQRQECPYFQPGHCDFIALFSEIWQAACQALFDLILFLFYFLTRRNCPQNLLLLS